jgi:hypothetical protein
MPFRRTRAPLATRGFVLLPVAAFAVHQLRYTLAYGGRSRASLSVQGHGYLETIAPYIGLLALLWFGSFVWSLVGATAGRRESVPQRTLAAQYLGTWIALVAVYVLQETLEGVFAEGHPSGVGSAFGHGGWWAIPVAGVAALVVVVVVRLASATVDLVASYDGRRAVVPAYALLVLPAAATIGRRSPLAGCTAGRAPPGSSLLGPS